MKYQQQKENLMMKYPAISDLANRARQRVPAVAWAYLQTGTGDEELLDLNRKAFTDFRLTPQFCKGPLEPNVTTSILGQNFDAPFGVAPVGLSGLMWPEAELMLAQTAVRYNIPYILSTVATETPERVGAKVGQQGWFQLYPPKQKDLRKKLLDRAKAAGFHTLVVTADVPTPSRRERTKRAGLHAPPKLTPSFLWQALTHPTWSYHTLRRGIPKLRTINEYIDNQAKTSISDFVQDELRGNLSWEYCKELRDIWQGPIILKGILHPKDAEKSVQIGFDGIVVSNHGGRQFDGAPAALSVLPDIATAVKGKTAILFDSGIRSGLDILRAFQQGAEFVLLGRSFLYGVAALGKYGGDHVTEILLEQLKNNMIQLGIDRLIEK